LVIWWPITTDVSWIDVLYEMTYGIVVGEAIDLSGSEEEKEPKEQRNADALRSQGSVGKKHTKQGENKGIPDADGGFSLEQTEKLRQIGRAKPGMVGGGLSTIGSIAARTNRTQMTAKSVLESYNLTPAYDGIFGKKKPGGALSSVFPPPSQAAQSSSSRAASIHQAKFLKNLGRNPMANVAAGLRAPPRTNQIPEPPHAKRQKKTPEK